MLKKILALTLVCASMIGAVSATVDETPQVGRYQMVSVYCPGEIKLYMLDTTNGKVWKSGLKNNWSEHDAWFPQIPELPQ